MRHACGCFVFLTGAVEIDQVKNTHEIRVCPFLMPIEEENHDYFCLLLLLLNSMLFNTRSFVK